jgi:NADPH:quinone reductase-like Zn-dependent oxidoreductase
MKTKQIVFTEVRKAEFLELDIPTVNEGDVLVEMEYTVVSGGTERACILGMNNTVRTFPLSLGYCGVGRVIEIGSSVKSVSVGDRVLVYHGVHTKYNVCP